MNNEELNRNVLKRVKRKIAISNFEKEETRMFKNRIGKMVATFALATGLTAGVVFAGTMVYEKVFKEPKKYESYGELIQDIKESQGSQEVTKEDEKKAVNMEEAMVEANKFLNKFGIDNQEFVTKELKKNYIMGAELVYYFTTDKNLNKGIHVGINAENGKFISFTNNNLAHSGFEPDKISKEQAIKKADEIYNLLDLKEKEYKINEVSEPPCYFPNNEGNSAEWCVTYYKVYGEALNQFERVQIMFTVVNGEVKVYSAFIANENVEYKDNPVQITKEEAEKIALEKDKKITDNEVDWIITKQQIRQINSWIYLLEQNGGKYPEFKEEKQADGSTVRYNEYQTVQNIARKVWSVNIHYKQGEPDSNNEKKYNSKSIFVDVTTGEVIGGADESYWD